MALIMLGPGTIDRLSRYFDRESAAV